MIPGGAVGISDESVLEAFSRSDGALLHSRNTIVPWGQLLEESMPMNGSAFLRTDDVIADIDGESITPIRFKSWSWESSIDEQGAPIDSIGSDETTGDVEVIIAGDTCAISQ